MDRSGKPLKLVLAAVCLLGWACANPGSYSIELLFPDEQSRQLTQAVRLVLVRPAAGAACAALQDGQAQPGDDGYAVEDEVTFTLPLGGEAPYLEVQAAGRILVYAEGSNAAATVIVNGCSEAQASLGGVHQVTVQLLWVRQPCTTDGDCDDDDPCSSDSCVEQLCQHQPAPAQTACDDGNWCTVQDGCDGAGNCGGQQRDCSQLDGQCLVGVCDEQQDSCVAQPANEGQPCDDGRFCTSGESCQAGVCGGGGATDCDDGVDCTSDYCDAQADACRNDPVDENCDDGVPCTADTCQADGCHHQANAGGCPTFHIGPTADGCPHRDAQGTATTDCDFSGESGLAEAVAAAPAEGAAFLLYAASGQPFWYQACELAPPGSSLIAAAQDVDRQDVIIYCPPVSPGINGILNLNADEVHIRDVTFVNLSGSNAAISAWPSLNQPDGASAGHLIENVVGMVLQPEVVGTNSIEEPVRLGSRSILRNSHFFGFYEASFRLAGKQEVSLAGNTMVCFQRAGGPITLEDSQDVTVANNLFLSLTDTRPALATASAGTHGLVLAGNLAEGYAELVTGLDPGDSTNLVRDNYLGQAQLESPLLPRFLADSDQTTGSAVPGSGTSLDGVALAGRVDLLPGAYQGRSAHGGPRRQVVRVGPGDCGGHGCDFTPDDDNELQQAVFSSWPGGTIEVYPYGDYAGDAIIPWGVRMVGQGSAEDVVLVSREEHPLWSQSEMWERHAGLLVVLYRQQLPSELANLSLVVSPDAQADDRAVMIEGSGESAPVEWHRLRHLVVTSQAGATVGLKQAFYLGDRVLLTDSLVHGAFASCIRFGVRAEERQATPPTSSRAINFTCRLTGTGNYAPESALDLASVTDGYLVNLALELEAPGAFLRAQRRSSGDTGATALDVPVSYTLHSVTVRGTTTNTDGYEPSDGDYTHVQIDHLDGSQPFFVSGADSHLASGCPAIDAGIDPATIDPQPTPPLSLGVSLDGIDRTTVMAVDRGCYEQGQ